MAMIGIDLGTTNSLVSIYQNGTARLIPNRMGSVMTPSAVSLMEDGSIVIGEVARERLISHPERTAAGFKQFMGTANTFRLGERIFEAQDLSALLLRQLKEDAETFLKEEVTEAVISVPAYFNDSQRSATKLAARLAGLQVNRLINEPSAAALFDRMGDKDSESKMLVIDFGGGTLDVSIVDCFENIVEIISISGDNHLGGQDIDREIVNRFYEETGLSEGKLSKEQKASLYQRAEKAKVHLTKPQNIVLSTDQTFSMELTCQRMAEICEPIFLRVREVIVRAVKNSGLRTSDITRVVLVGGSSKLEVFADFLENLFGMRPEIRENAEEMVARGLGLCCGIKNRDIKDVVMTDVCPFSLGVGVHNNADPDRMLMEVLIPRCSMLPSSFTKRLFTVYSNQPQVKCQLFQGENLYTDENLKIGELTVRVPLAPAGISWVELTFTYDIDGILQAEVVSNGGQSSQAVIVNPMLDIGEKELQQKVEALERLKQKAGGCEEDRLILARLERIYCELLGAEREQAALLYQQFQETIKFGGIIELKKNRESIKEALARLENQDLTDLHLPGAAKDMGEEMFYS